MTSTAGPPPRRAAATPAATAAWRDGAVAVVAGVASTFAASTWFSRALYDRAAFDGQYDHGVYRPRVVGRELVRAVHHVIGNPLPGWVSPSGRAGLPHGDLYSAMTLVNLVAFLAFATLAHVVVGRAGLPEPHRTLVFATLVLAVAATGYVVTPYDQLSYVLLLAALVAATARPPWDLAAPVLVAVGVANRESALLAVAALWAVWWVRRDDRRLATIAATSSLAGVAAYASVRVGAAQGGAGPSLWSGLTLAGNVGRLTGWVGALLLVALLVWWRGTAEVAGLGTSGEARTAVRAYWLLALPYLLVAGLTGYWFEVRLLAPVLVGELWVRARSGPVA
ncbi:hypothetical protein KSP35_01375 [Aquihabitans sp. G128]|uniref:hypothetical protein n=1 Tax=Aquihabitans sp. G128 TaxID=2849779 RepID=UPI001C2161B0|nr:hypothetical protein [Aquihabitans sp. G128]QXC61529.1 hypothetical protein KSP35_01375 [Aquihabitans sp. G128]